MEDVPTTLWQVSREIELALKELAHLEDDETYEEVRVRVQERLERLSITIETKWDNCARMIKNTDAETALLESRLEVRENECKILKTRIRGQKRLGAWLREYVKVNMGRLGFKKLETPSGIKLTIRKNAVSCEVTHQELVPEEYIRVRREPNKKALVDNFKETGEVFQGVIFHTDKTSLLVK